MGALFKYPWDFKNIYGISQNLTVLKFLKRTLNTEIIQSTFTDYYTIKLEINNIKVAKVKYTFTL